MLIDRCRSCGQESELHKDKDGKLVCGDCYAGNSSVGNRLAKNAHDMEQTRSAEHSQRYTRSELLDYIVANADDSFIKSIVRKTVAQLKTDLISQRGWIRLIQDVDDIHSLLRIAIELGYRLPPSPTAQETNEKELDSAAPNLNGSNGILSDGDMTDDEREANEEEYHPSDPPVEGSPIL